MNSTGSTTKYDPDLLKSDVQHAKARVQRLKRELANIDTEMHYKQKGVETLAMVSAKYEAPHTASAAAVAAASTSSTAIGGNLSLEEAAAIRAELHNIQRSLSTGEQEKVELMKSLACLKDELTRLHAHPEDPEISEAGGEKFSSAASQTDLSGMEASNSALAVSNIPVGARLAEMARLRMQYDEARRQVQEIQQALASMEERMQPGQLESDKDRLLLIQDKEQLLRELKAITTMSRTRSHQEMNEIKLKIRDLERDLDNAMEVSNRCIAERYDLFSRNSVGTRPLS